MGSWPTKGDRDEVDGAEMARRGIHPVLVVYIDGAEVWRGTYSPKYLDGEPVDCLDELARDDARELLTARWEVNDD